MKRDEAAQVVATLVGAFANAKFTEINAEIYETMLADLDFEQAKQAVLRLSRRIKFLPTIAEVREEATALQLGAPRTGGEAWGDVVLEIRRIGYVGKPEFSDPIVVDIVRRWGWRQLCCEGSDVADRARFIELYDQLTARHRSNVVTGIPLPEHRASNALSTGGKLLHLTAKIGKCDEVEPDETDQVARAPIRIE